MYCKDLQGHASPTHPLVPLEVAATISQIQTFTWSLEKLYQTDDGAEEVDTTGQELAQFD
jgi:hypothetical protein